MASPIVPQDIKNCIAAAAGNLCGKFMAVFNLPKRIYDWFVWMYNEDGSFTVTFKAFLCEQLASCIGTGGGSGGGGGGGGTTTLAAPVLAATSGSFTDMVVMTWAGITGATSYDLYRSETNDSGTASLLTNTASLTFQDTGVTAGTVYYYWAKARNTSAVSAYSAGVSGYAATTLDAVADLVCSQGFVHTTSSGRYIYLAFGKVSGATAYDIYRGTTADFAAAAIISGGASRVPFDNTDTISTSDSASTGLPLFIDNGTDLTFHDNTIPSGYEYEKFYYWVVPKKLVGTAVVGLGAESNMGTGWVVGNGVVAQTFLSGALTVNNQTYTVPAGAVRCYAVLYGGGAGGAGGNTAYGGGGGGGGAVAWGTFPVVAGNVIRFLTGAAEAQGGASATDGVDGPTSSIQYDNGTPTTMLASTGPGKGVWNAGGAGAGGAGAVASAGVTVTDPVLKNGRAGEAGSGSRGGRGGHRFGWYRYPAQNYTHAGYTPGPQKGLYGNGGSGSSTVNPASLATGGDSQIGYVVFHFLNT